MPAIHRYALVAGLLSGFLFTLNWTGLIDGQIVKFAPLLPLFWAGFRLGGHAIGHAALIATVFSLLFLGMQTTAMVVMVYVVPCWLFGRQLLKARLTRQGGIEWYSAGNAMVALITYVGIAFMTVAYYVAGGESDLLAMVERQMDADVEGMSPELGEAVAQYGRQYPFLIFGYSLAWELLLMYAAACFANFVCVSYGKALRRSLRFDPFDPPVYVPLWLLFCGVVGFFVPHETAYIPQTVFFIFLMVYFILGVALLHRQARGWEGRGYWLTLFYILLILFQWPALGLAIWGFWRHMRTLAGYHPTKDSR